jgi:hypothetical protein
MASTHATADVDSYDSLLRFESYWTQIEEILRVTPRGGSMLEIGKGTGVTAWYVQNAGIDVKTMDHLPSKQPSVVGDLRELPFADRSFDTVVAFQILEHLEFKFFTHCLRELARVAKDNVVVSLPNSSSSIAVSASLPRMGRIRKVWGIPFVQRKSVAVKPFHHWEIGVVGYSLPRVRASIADAGLSIDKEFRFVENPFHHFFILRKTAPFPPGGTLERDDLSWPASDVRETAGSGRRP